MSPARADNDGLEVFDVRTARQPLPEREVRMYVCGSR
jgi:hypothetical protein